MPQDYLLNRDRDESRRSFGYLLHPTILPTLAPTARIADVGAGTCAWLLAVASSLGNHGSYDGFDISADQFPPKDSLPENFTLHVSDVKSPFAKEHHGKFDLIHLRLLVLAMEGPEHWRVALENVRKLLKPGGYVQWEEADFTLVREPLRAFEHSQVRALREGFQQLMHMVWERIKECPNRLLNAYREVEMREIDFDVVSCDRLPEMREVATKMEIGVLEGTLKQRNGQRAPASEETEKLLRDMEAEAESDFLCPWVYIGYTQLQSAITTHTTAHPHTTIQTTYHAYYLDPYAPPFGIHSAAYIDRIRGPARSGASLDRVREMQQRFGVTLNSGGKMGHTRRAHRLVRFARERYGLEAQDKVVSGVFELFWGREGDVTDRVELARVGLQAGCGGYEEVLGFLEGEELEEVVDGESERARDESEGGGMGVPRFVINGGEVVDGAKGLEAFLSAFEEVEVGAGA
ncbi:MAG: hypothetical protein M1831_006839 [Alyxoria varia]|nr:MAG: hypothetical protein M1831_006839 [Alyxoria varia]